MAFLAVPGPFDFALTTERFRAFGVDRATVWHEGGLHRVVGGREVRIEAAPGGVDVEPLDAETEPVVRTCSGSSFELEPFYAWAAGDEVLGPATTRLAGFRPPLAPDPFEMLVGAITAQQVSLFSATAIRNRMIERFGTQVGAAWAFPTRDRLAAATEEELVALGFSRRKAEYMVGLARSDLDLDALARSAGRRGEGAARRAARPRRVDGRLVPRASSRAPARVAVGRPRAAQGGGGSLWWPRRPGGARALPPVRESLRPLPPARPTRPVIRTATPDDLPLVARALARAFNAEIPDARVARRRHATRTSRELEQAIGKDVVLLADDVGLAVATKTGARLGFLDILYVRARGARHAASRRSSCARRRRQLREQRRRGARARGARSRTSGARAVYERWGFAPVELTLAAPIDALVRRLDSRDGGPDVRLRSTSRPTTWAPSSAPCRRRCRGSAARSARGRPGPTTAGCTVHDELCDRDPTRAAASRQGAVVRERRRRARARRRGRRGRALHALRPRRESSTSTRRCRSTTARCRPAT